MSRTPSVIVIGAGMSGICMAVKLRDAGITDLTMLEKAGEVGGTWRDNSYPGLRCDVPSAFYQYWFDRNPDWSHFFSRGGEIGKYFRDVVDRFGLKPYLRLGTEVNSAEYTGGRWRVDCSDGEVREADFLIAATGVLHHPVLPDIPGRDTFTGAAFHSARWDHSVPLEDKRIGVIGTGSTGVQIVTELGGKVPGLTLFQRTAQWVLPVPNWRNGPVSRTLRKRIPGATAIEYRAVEGVFGTLAAAVIRPGWQRRLISGLCRGYLRTVRDPELRRKLTPDYQPLCKRLVMTAGFYGAVQRPGVEVVTDRIERIVPEGVMTADGAVHELDVLVFATGFDSHAYLRPIQLTAPNGTTLEQAWSDGPRAYRTVALPAFPNFFMLMGPHSPVGNFSLVPIAEVQADYALGWIKRWQRGEFEATAPSAKATEAYNAEIRAAMPGTVWASGCDSWYLGKDGTPEVWPFSPHRHARMLREAHAEEFEPVPQDTTSEGARR